MSKKSTIINIPGLKELTKKGKQKGVLTYGEIMDALQSVDLLPEQIEEIYDHIQQQESILSPSWMRTIWPSWSSLMRMMTMP